MLSGEGVDLVDGIDEAGESGEVGGQHLHELLQGNLLLTAQHAYIRRNISLYNNLIDRYLDIAFPLISFWLDGISEQKG